MGHYDLIVIGTGGIGSAAMYEAARRGLRVLGLDRFGPAHDRGSSHGQTRIIRQAYFEHPDYVPLLLKSYQGWEELQSSLGQQLFFPVGLIEAGPPEGIVTAGVLEADARHQLGVETIPLAEARQRFPGFRFEDDWQVVFEPQAGYLLVEKCIEAHLHRAGREGAEHRCHEEVTRWAPLDDGFRVQTKAGNYTAAHLIITGGAWAEELLAGVNVSFRVLRKHLHWYADAPRELTAPQCPAYFFETPQGYFYGFPAVDSRGIKVAEHSGGTQISDPLNDPRTSETADQQRVEAFMRRQMPTAGSTRSEHAVCFYTCTPDDHFVVDRHPTHPGVAFAAGLSGHGFKFAPVLAEALVALAVEGQTDLPVDFLRLNRPALNPSG